MDLQEVGVGGADWMELAENWEKWRTLMSTVKNLSFHKNAGNFLPSRKHWLVSQEGLCSME
jgi:hypothetical protein